MPLKIKRPPNSGRTLYGQLRRWSLHLFLILQLFHTWNDGAGKDNLDGPLIVSKFRRTYTYSDLWTITPMKNFVAVFFSHCIEAVDSELSLCKELQRKNVDTEWSVRSSPSWYTFVLFVLLFIILIVFTSCCTCLVTLVVLIQLWFILSSMHVLIY